MKKFSIITLLLLAFSHPFSHSFAAEARDELGDGAGAGAGESRAGPVVHISPGQLDAWMEEGKSLKESGGLDAAWKGLSFNNPESAAMEVLMEVSPSMGLLKWLMGMAPPRRDEVTEWMALHERIKVFDNRAWDDPAPVINLSKPSHWVMAQIVGAFRGLQKDTADGSAWERYQISHGCASMSVPTAPSESCNATLTNMVLAICSASASDRTTRHNEEFDALTGWVLPHLMKGDGAERLKDWIKVPLGTWFAQSKWEWKMPEIVEVLGGPAKALPVLKDIATTWTEIDGSESDRAIMLQFLFEAVLPVDEWTAWWAFFKTVDMEEDKAMVGKLLKKRIAPITKLIDRSNSKRLRDQCEGFWEFRKLELGDEDPEPAPAKRARVRADREDSL